MNPTQRQAFTRATRGLAHELDTLITPEATLIDVEKTEDLATKLIMGIKKAYEENSTEYEVQVRDTTNYWYVPEVWAERQKNRTLKHIYENSNYDPIKKKAWKDQEKKLTNLCKKYKNAERKGQLDKVVTQKDMAKLTKYAK